MDFTPHHLTLNRITLENFQAIQKRTKIPISPLTFLYGPNSSGKSAIHDALIYAETVFSGDSETLMSLTERWRYNKPNDDTPRDMLIIIEGYVERDVMSSAVGDPGFFGTISDHVIPNVASGIDYTISGYMRRKQEQYPDSYQMTMPVSIEIKEMSSVHMITLFLDEKCVFRSTQNDQGIFKVEVSKDFLGDQLESFVEGFDLDINNPVHYSVDVIDVNRAPLKYEFPDNIYSNGIENYDVLKKTLLETVNYYLYLLRHVTFVPKLVHSDRGTIRTDTLAWMDHAVGKRLNTHPTIGELASNENAAKWVNHCLANHLFLELDQCYQIAYKRDGLLVECSLIDKAGRTTSFEDVGTGISCLIPVLAALHEISSFIQQPELHLHPALQAALGDICIEAFQSSASFVQKSKFPAFGIRYNAMIDKANMDARRGSTRHMVETHSEHLLLRVLKRIRQTHLQINIAPELKINADDVCVLYFNPLPDGTTAVKRLRITEDGEFMDRWPRGFFAERDQELFDE